MKQMSASQMKQVEGGADYVFCGIGVGMTVASLIYAPFLAPSAAELAMIACVTGQ